MTTTDNSIPDFLDRRPKAKAKAKPKSWRDVIAVHPAAELFLPMTPDELKALGEDIKRHGFRVPIVFWSPDGSDERFLLDGRNRLNAAEVAGIDVMLSL